MFLCVVSWGQWWQDSSPFLLWDLSAQPPLCSSSTATAANHGQPVTLLSGDAAHGQKGLGIFRWRIFLFLSFYLFIFTFAFGIWIYTEVTREELLVLPAYKNHCKKGSSRWVYSAIRVFEIVWILDVIKTCITKKKDLELH